MKKKKPVWTYVPAPPGWRYKTMRPNTIRAFLFDLFEKGLTYLGSDRDKVAALVNEKFKNKRTNTKGYVCTPESFRVYYAYWRKMKRKTWRTM